MKKLSTGKKVALAVALAITTLAIVAFTGRPDNAGYVAFKEMLKREPVQTSQIVSAKLEFKVTDNGRAIVNVNGSFTSEDDGDQFGGEARILSGDLDKVLHFYKNGDDVLFQAEGDADVYRAQDVAADEFEDEEIEEGLDFESEALLDFFLKDLAKEFEVTENADGTSEITLDITESEMPWIIQTLMKKAMEDEHVTVGVKEDRYDAYPLLKEMAALAEEPVELVDNVKFTGIRVSFQQDQNQQVQGFGAQLSFSGNDAQGQSHEMDVQLKVVPDAQMTTSIQPIQTEGKTVYDLPKDHSFER